MFGVLEKKTRVALTWLKQNQVELIANPEKFLATLIRKGQTNTRGANLVVNGELIKSEEAVKLLGIYLDYKLNFQKYISETCKKDAS